MKQISTLLLCLCVSSCTLVQPYTPEYPVIHGAERMKLAKIAAEHGIDASKALADADSNSMLNATEIDQLRLLLKIEHEDEIKARYQEREAARTEFERKKADREASYEKKQQDEKVQRIMTREAEFRRSFEDIYDPYSAQLFRSLYANQPDPDGLLGKAEARGYRQGVNTAKRCIEMANATIAQQNKIAQEVGYIDKTVMYRAGQQLVICKQHLADWSKKAGK